MTTVLAPHDQGAPRPRRRRLRSTAFFPALLTIGNLICGFAAIHFAMRAMLDFGAGIPPEQVHTLESVRIERILPSFLSVGAGLVILGMVFDCFDGLVARVTRSTTDFGGQLDSLADVVNCGVAPAALMVAFMTQELLGDSILPSPVSEHFLGRVTWVSAAVYVAFTAIRLARYNVEHKTAEFDYRAFRGLPSPGAASVIVMLIIMQDQVGPLGRGIIVYTLPAVALATAFLMVSRIPYKRFYRAYLVGRQPISHFIGFVAIFAIFWSYKAPTLLVLVFWYWLSGPVGYLIRAFRVRRSAMDLGEPKVTEEYKRLAEQE